MSENRQKKEAMVQDLARAFEANSTFYLLDFMKMSVLKSNELRGRLRENGCSMKVIKNRLALRALGNDYPDELKECFQGPTAVAYTDEKPIELARLIKDFSAQNKSLKVKAGIVDGDFLSRERFAEIAALTSKMDLVAKIGFLMAYPLMQLLRTWQAPYNSVGSMLSQLKSKK